MSDQHVPGGGEPAPTSPEVTGPIRAIGQPVPAAAVAAVVCAGAALAISAVIAARVSWGLWLCLAVVAVVVVVALVYLSRNRSAIASAQRAAVPGDAQPWGPPATHQDAAPPVLFTHAPRPEQVLGKLSGRLLTLVGRMIAHLDSLEHETEDPDQLAGLFKLDHMTTQLRRQVENIEVMRGEGGLLSREESPLPVREVLMSACSEIEDYRQVDVLPSPDVQVHGRAVAEVIHLLAELVENATQFQNPTAPPVEVRAFEVRAGLCIQIRDRGVGIPDNERDDYNHLLAPSTAIDLGKILTNDQIGLAVVKGLSQRFGIAVQLNKNIFGGTDADVVLPHDLILAPLTDRPVPVATSAQPPRPHPRPRPQSGVGSTDSVLPQRRPSAADHRQLEMPAAATVTAAPDRPADNLPVRDPGVSPQQGDRGLPPLPRRGTSASHLPPQLRTPSSQPPVYTGHSPSLLADARAGLAEGIAGGDLDTDNQGFAGTVPEANSARSQGDGSWNTTQ